MPENEEKTIESVTVEINNQQNYPFDMCDSEDISRVQFLHHAGVLFFSAWLSRLDQLHGGTLLKQWLALVLLEAVNIEQSKYVNWECLSLFFGTVLSGTVEQRLQLERIASTDTDLSILQVNAEVADVAHCDDFYYDPHTKHYTGMHKLLKGWCSAIRWADKALHSDFIHTVEGMPVYMHHADNYQDLRERFFPIIAKFRQTVALRAEKKITIIIDRGIYSIETFQSVKKDSNLELISWEKGYKAGEYDSEKCDGQFCYSRLRNHATDKRLYTFAYMDKRWERDPEIRKLIVVATNPKAKTVEVSILCTDLQRNAQEVILLIFKRWIQENDFKYLDKHYGINQITSYATIPYEKLRETIEDKQEQSAQKKALLLEKRSLENHLKTMLHKEHKQSVRMNSLNEALHKINTSADKEIEASERKRRSRLQAQLTRATKTSDAIAVQKNEYDRLIVLNQQQLADCDQSVSKLDRLVHEGYERLDTKKKRVMDCIKILARNIFYAMIASFKKSYNNYRDDHQYFREFTHAPGFWVQNGTTIVVYIYPAAHLPPKLRTCFEQILDEVQQKPLLLPDGSGRTFTLQLASPEGFKLAMG